METKPRIEIHISQDHSYAAQSSATAKVWTDGGWKQVARLLNVHVPKRGMDQFAHDRDELLRIVIEVLS